MTDKSWIFQESNYHVNEKIKRSLNLSILTLYKELFAILENRIPYRNASGGRCSSLGHSPFAAVVCFSGVACKCQSTFSSS